MKLRRSLTPRAGLLAAIPFLAAVASDQVAVQTIIYPQGTGVRRVVVNVDTRRIKPVANDLRVVYPSWRHWKSGRTLLEAEKIIDPPNALDGVTVKVIGSPFSFTREYVFEEKITVADSLSTDKDQKIREQVPVAYTVTMPAPVTEAPGAQIEGRTATFKLTLSDDGKTITVKARGIRFIGWAFLLYAVLVVFVGLLNLFIPPRERRIQTKTEAAENSEPSEADSEK